MFCKKGLSLAVSFEIRITKAAELQEVLLDPPADLFRLANVDADNFRISGIIDNMDIDARSSTVFWLYFLTFPTTLERLQVELTGLEQ